MSFKEKLDASRYLKKYSWSKASITIFNKKYQLKDLEQTKIIASPVFLEMWDIWKVKSQKSAQRKLLFLLNLLDIPVNLFKDKKSIEKILEKFSKNLDPASYFWSNLADLVQKVYPEPLLLEGDFGRRVHNLRYFISCQQAEYIRNLSGTNDADKLSFYLAKLEWQEYDLFESDRLHQKKADYGRGLWPEDYYQGNIKVLVNFNSEFILNSRGDFQNILDPTSPSTNGVINGASFNFAHKNDFKANQVQSTKSVHGRLDVLVGQVEPEFRKILSANDGKPYRAPSQSAYVDSIGLYAQNDLSVSERSFKIHEDFIKLIQNHKNS